MPRPSGRGACLRSPSERVRRLRRTWSRTRNATPSSSPRRRGATSNRGGPSCPGGCRLSAWGARFPVTSRPSSKGAWPPSSGPSRRGRRAPLSPMTSQRASSHVGPPDRAAGNHISTRSGGMRTGCGHGGPGEPGGLVGGQVAAFGRVARGDQRQHEGAKEALVDPHALDARHLLRELRLEPCGPGEGEARALCHPEDGGQQRPKLEFPLRVPTASAYEEEVEPARAKQGAHRYGQGVVEPGVRPLWVEKVRA